MVSNIVPKISNCRLLPTPGPKPYCCTGAVSKPGDPGLTRAWEWRRQYFDIPGFGGL